MWSLSLVCWHAFYVLLVDVVLWEIICGFTMWTFSASGLPFGLSISKLIFMNQDSCWISILIFVCNLMHKFSNLENMNRIIAHLEIHVLAYMKAFSISMYFSLSSNLCVTDYIMTLIWSLLSIFSSLAATLRFLSWILQLWSLISEAVVNDVEAILFLESEFKRLC